MRLTKAGRGALTEQIWSRVASDRNAYGNLIDRLLATLTDEQLQRFVAEEADDPECDGCGQETPPDDLKTAADDERLCPECYRDWEEAGAADVRAG